MSKQDGRFIEDGPPEGRRHEPADVGAAYARHHQELRAYLIGLLRDRDAAEEILQAVCLKAVGRRESISSESIRAWLFRVAHNEGIDWRRRRTQESRAITKLAWWNQRTEPTPETSILRQEQATRVREAVAKLPADQQEIVRARIDQEKTFAQIASDLNLPLGTVLTRMRLASARLTRALRGEMEP